MKAHIQKSKLEQLGVPKIPNMKMLKEILEKFGNEKDDNRIFNGDIVKLNVQKIVSRTEWNRLTNGYRMFVENNAGKEFTAEIVDSIGVVVQFREDMSDPKWCFCVDDLILVKHSFDKAEDKE